LRVGKTIKQKNWLAKLTTEEKKSVKIQAAKTPQAHGRKKEEFETDHAAFCKRTMGRCFLPSK
jgi:hypothetical protein